MNEELDIDDLAITVDPAACIEVSRSPSAMVKATVQTVTDILLAVFKNL
jgi:hypothetical protein